MPMGRERAVVRWDAHTALLDRERARIEAELAALEVGETPDTPAWRNRAQQLRQAWQEVLSRQRALGPSPRAKMG